MNRLLSLVAAVTFSALSMVSPAQAAFYDAGETLSFRLPIQDDLYAAGGQLTLDAPVEGDVVLAGGIMQIKGDIREDLTTVGGYVTVDSTVGDDIRALAGDLAINGEIGDDLIVTGGSVTINPGASVNGDIYLTAGRLILKGDAAGNVHIAAGIAILDGPIAGDLVAEGGNVSLNGQVAGSAQLVSDEVSFGADARINGDLTYWQKGGEMELADGVVGGTVLFDESLRRWVNIDIDRQQIREVKQYLWTGWMTFQLLSSALIILVLVLTTKRFFPRVAKHFHKKTLMSFLVGLGFLVLTPILALLLMASIIGIPLAFLLMVGYLALVCLLKPLSALVIAHCLDQYFGLKSKKMSLFLISLGALLGLMLLSWIPWFGWLIQLVIAVIVLGAFLIQEQVVWKKEA